MMSRSKGIPDAGEHCMQQKGFYQTLVQRIVGLI